jgi:hypothetical protein
MFLGGIGRINDTSDGLKDFHKDDQDDGGCTLFVTTSSDLNWADRLIFLTISEINITKGKWVKF